MSTLFRMRLVYYVSMGLALLGAGACIATLDIVSARETSSVEIGLAELSPKGEAGGYAVPASGSSGLSSLGPENAPQLPTCTLHLSPQNITQGTNAQVAWTWTAGSNVGYPLDMTIQRVSYQTGAIEAVLQTRNSPPTTTRQVCFLFWCWDHSEPASSGTSASYDAKTSALEGGQYAYRGVITANGLGNVCYINQTVTGTGPNLQGTIGNLGTLVERQSTPITYGVRNVGVLNVAVDTIIELQFDYKRDGWNGHGKQGDFAITATAGALAANGGSQSFTTNGAFATIGDWRVRAIADMSGLVAESSESDNASAWDDFVVIASPVSASLDAQSASAGINWTGSNFSIVTGHEVELRWSSVDATSCSGSNFITGNATQNSGMTPGAQPSGEQSVTYTLTCRDADGFTATDQITIAANDVAPTISSSKTTVRISDPFTLTWNLNGNDPAQCVITGPGSTFSAEGSMSQQSGETTINAVGTATYTLDCPGGEDTVEINVLPQIFET